MLKNFFIFALIFFLTGCSSMLYQPSNILFYPPEKLGLKPKDVVLNVAPNVKLHGWYFKSTHKKTKALIIFFHGNAENLTSHYTTLAWILPHGYDFFIWDYRGYGLSSGKPSPENTVEDGKKIILQMHNDYPKLPLVIFAQSLGSPIALRDVIDLNHSVALASVVVDSGFSSYIHEAQFVVSKHWFTWILQPLAYILMSDKYAPAGKLDQISPTPLLVMHGTSDQTVSYEFGQEIYEHAKEPKKFISIEGGQHIDSFWKHDFIYRKKFLDYLSSVLLKRPSFVSRGAKKI